MTAVTTAAPRHDLSSLDAAAASTVKQAFAVKDVDQRLSAFTVACDAFVAAAGPRVELPLERFTLGQFVHDLVFGIKPTATWYYEALARGAKSTLESAEQAHDARQVAEWKDASAPRAYEQPPATITALRAKLGEVDAVMGRLRDRGYFGKI